EE
ncbi:hypothetical protein POUND7_007517, partial [Theobroma cacao]